MSTQRPPSGRRRPRPSRCRNRTTADTPPRAASYLAVGSGDAPGAAWAVRFQVWTSGPAYWFPRSSSSTSNPILIRRRDLGMAHVLSSPSGPRNGAHAACSKVANHARMYM